ncbi:MAG: Fur family transcriptional regulator [Gammaproteobacteria bacterium]|nr:Fur family transcriptional regulator [Gammaproteobacteria bacterium]MCY4218497.1 Fur family transcriptional regulator [Gammaproteobacteria bacterium]MCY4276161.1 Fur family transcriptional regulator [Gammaproteobacteria bacterium]
MLATTRFTHAERVLKYLKQQKRPLTAYEILEGLREDGVTAPTTVYRALNKLLEDGQLHRIESLNAWTVCSELHHTGTPIFEICDSCSNVRERVDSRLSMNIKAISLDSGFTPDRSIIEIHGLCSDCSTS